jgi:hypothetical protein
MPWLPMSASAVPEPGEDGERSIPVESIPEPSELETWKWEQHRLETDVAANLGFSVGAVKAGRRARTLIAEFSRSKTIQSGDSQVRYGVAARLVVNVLGFDADANLTLPFVAASAEFNQLEAYADLTIEGYAGADTGALFPPFATFDVESYVKLMDALTSMKGVIGKNEDNIRPARLWAWSAAPDTDIDA